MSNLQGKGADYNLIVSCTLKYRRTSADKFQVLLCQAQSMGMSPQFLNQFFHLLLLITNASYQNLVYQLLNLDFTMYTLA